MDIDKKKVRRAFSRAAATYDGYSALQRSVARESSLMLPEELPHGPVADIGCGTGNLLLDLTGRFGDRLVIGLDLSPAMLGEAARRLPSKRTIKKPLLCAADLEALPFKDSSLALLCSSLAYQWASEIDRAIDEAARTLKPGGQLVLATLGEGTFHELKASLEESGMGGHLPKFIKGTEFFKIIKEAGFQITERKERERVVDYADLFALLHTLKAIGATNPHFKGEKNLARGAFLKKTAIIYKENYSNKDKSSIRATYNILYVRAVKL